MTTDKKLAADCESARKLLAQGRSGGIDELALAKLEEHLLGCIDCASFEAEVGRARIELNRISQLDVPDRLLLRLQRIPEESFPCHQFGAAAAEALSSRDEGKAVTPSARLARHLTVCPACDDAWKSLHLLGTLPVVGPRRDHFRLLNLVPAVGSRAGKAWSGGASISGWRRFPDLIFRDTRWTVAAAYAAAMIVVLIVGSPSELARNEVGRARSVASRLAATLPSGVQEVNRGQFEFQAARTVARGKALSLAYAQAYTEALKRRVLGFASSVWPGGEPAKQRRNSSEKPIAPGKMTLIEAEREEKYFG